MLNHARAALRSRSNIAVDLIGIASKGIDQIGFDDPRLRVHPIGANPACLNKLKSIFWPLYALLRLLLITVFLIWILLIRVPTPSFMLMQNPPTFPVLPVLILARCIRGASLAIDWHNFGYTILQVNRRGKIPVLIAKMLEKRLSYFADFHYCVSKAMQQFLLNQFHRRAEVVYDLKTKKFEGQLSVAQLHALYLKYDCVQKTEHEITYKTERMENTPQFRNNRPLVAITSTSFTPDQDFGLLLKTLDQLSVRLSFLDETISHSKFGQGVKFVLFITGRGPQKAFYEEEVKKRGWQNQWKAKFLWIDADDYPQFVKSADLGICLHASSSGLDLPMKVVDLFSAGVPVLAKKYKTIGELVKKEINGKLFETQQELAELLFVIQSNFQEFIMEREKLQGLREGIKSTFGKLSWDEQWKQIVLPDIERKIKED